MKQPVLVERENARFKAQLVTVQRAQEKRQAQEAVEKAAQRAKWRDISFPNPPTVQSSAVSPKKISRPHVPSQSEHSKDGGYER